MIQFTPDLTNGSFVDAFFRVTDQNNAYRVRVTTTDIQLHTLVNGTYTAVDDPVALTCPSPPCAVKIKLDGTSIKVWQNATLRIDETDSTWGEGGVAFASNRVKIDDLKIGHDVNDDDDLDDAGDDIMFSETFGSNSKSPAHDHAGNLVDDGRLMYRYDAWNRLVRVRSKEDDVTIHAAEFYGDGRRSFKTVTNAGQYDGTEVYYHDGQKIIAVYDGSGNPDVHRDEFIAPLTRRLGRSPFVASRRGRFAAGDVSRASGTRGTCP